jgi:glutathione S-transferase
MAPRTLVVGNKNYSSWSLRPWLALRVAGIPFEEILILIHQPETKAQILKYSPAGFVPVLKDGDVTVWDSLSICEYLAETFPEAKLWPADRAARAKARSISAEMHSGFTALRRDLSMDIRARISKPFADDAKADIARICEIWRECRQSASGGPFLFGHFTIADAMYAPVAARFQTYGVELDPVCAAYRDTILGLAPMKEWIAAGANDPVLD